MGFNERLKKGSKDTNNLKNDNNNNNQKNDDNNNNSTTRRNNVNNSEQSISRKSTITPSSPLIEELQEMGFVLKKKLFEATSCVVFLAERKKMTDSNYLLSKHSIEQEGNSVGKDVVLKLAREVT